jgi:RNA polymerase sigma factor (TIGR02999 family)
MSEVTKLLDQLKHGDAAAADRLLATVYDELRRLAAKKMAGERPGQTLQATALVHEAYLRLVGNDHPQWENRGHFFGAAAEAMRRILVEAARRKGRIKHGGGRERYELNEADCIALPQSVDLLALDEALANLAAEDQVKADLVKLRFFTGLTVEQAGEALGVSRATADRYWTFARAWLFREIRKGDDTPGV